MHLRIIIALLSIAPCAGFGTVSGPGAGCVDAPAHLVAEETAKMGEWYAQFTSCDAVAQVGGCARSAVAQAACCATCAVEVPARTTYSGDPDPVKNGGLCDAWDECASDYCQEFWYGSARTGRGRCVCAAHSPRAVCPPGRVFSMDTAG